MTTTDTTTHLHTVINHWTDLQDALATHQADTWPPVMGINRLTETIEEQEARAAQAATERTDRRTRDGISGESPAPLRIAILDTMLDIERDLADLADATASTVQRPPVARVRSAGPGDEHGLTLATASITDQADKRRWSYADPRTRTAPYAAAWLLARWEDAPGPFRELRSIHRDEIAAVARSVAQRIDVALEMARRQRDVSQPCPHCRGQLRIYGADGQPPALKCTGCGWTRRAPEAA